MWQLGLLSALILTSSCCVAQQWRSEEYDSLNCGHFDWSKPPMTLNDGQIYHHQVPWIVNIVLNNGHDRCDGSLIHPQAVLTAAICVSGRNSASTTVLAGQMDPYHLSEVVQQSGVDNIIIHKDFMRNTKYIKNFAILILEKPFVLTENVGVVCLLGKKLPLVTTPGILGGWQIRNHSKSVQVDWIGGDVCAKKLRQMGLSHVPLDPSPLCTEANSSMVICAETFGGPASHPVISKSSDYHYWQLAVLSWNPWCGSSSGAPTVWSGIQDEDRIWIENTLLRNNLSI